MVKDVLRGGLKYVYVLASYKNCRLTRKITAYFNHLEQTYNYHILVKIISSMISSSCIISLNYYKLFFYIFRHLIN